MRRLLGLVCALSAIFFVAGRVCLRRWLGGADKPVPLEVPPITFFRPIKAGEAGVWERMRTFGRGVRAGDQILLGVATEADELVAVELRREFSHLNVEVVRCPGGRFSNPKINKLSTLEPLALHDRWMVFDSDAMVDADCLERLRGEWAAAGTEALTAPYFFVETGNTAARLDAAGTEIGLWPGVALMTASGPLQTMFGACLGVRADTVRRAGGWAAFGSELAEDHALGQAVAASGGRIHLAKTAIPICAGRLGTGEWLAHQHRAFATYHRCSPVGALGLPVTFGVAFSFLAFVATRSWAALGWHMLLLGLRVRVADALPGGRRHSLPILLVASILEPLFWFAGRLPLAVTWRGVRFGNRQIAPCPPGETG